MARQQAALTARASRVRRGVSARDALDGAVTAIAAAGCDSPRLDAELLLAHVLGIARERLYIDREIEIAGAQSRAFQDAVRRRAVHREPLAYITGRRAFRRLQLAVDARALIPRPETELLVEVGLRLAPNASVLDLATGSGAVALALADERPDLRVSASDVSPDALDLARENAARLGLEVSWIAADLLSGVGDEFDAILANLPYIPDGELAQLAPEITRHEPRGALAGGEDGLAVVGRLIEQARRSRALTLALEVGAGQAPSVCRLAEQAGFTAVHSERDLAGIERAVVAERTAS